MSSALVRQALEFVDEESVNPKRKNKRRLISKQSAQRGQGLHPYKPTKKELSKQVSKTKEEITEDNIKKLLALSRPTIDNSQAEKIIERAIKGKPLLDKIEVNKEEVKSILFPEESTETFET